ncbi:hypothetical protein FWH58_03740 [Candidatus Saccharibacteria bacterium]|nr:hypothetical protein [Candidatus Saccharibacteria bacterium]
MYSGTTIRKGSGKIIGTHQKIDRVVRRKLQPHIPSNIQFPTAREILKFEGLNGPDGIKKKSPARDEPWHYIDPTNAGDRQILDLIRGHENNLIAALREKNRERAAFEAAWLAHAITDGLTPAHHFPYEERMEEIRGEELETRTTFAKKVIMPGENLREKLVNNWEYWNLKDGLLTAHGFFEFGVAGIAAPLRFEEIHLSSHDRLRIQRAGGIAPLYMDIVWRIYDLHIYDKFLETSWTNRLALVVKNDLMPTIIHTVLMSWYYCAWRAAQK